MSAIQLKKKENLLRWLSSFSSVRLYYLGFGFLPILCISLSVQEIIPLAYSGPGLVFPFCFCSMVVAVMNRDIGYKALIGFVSGIISVAIYDAVGWALFLLDCGEILFRK